MKSALPRPAVLARHALVWANIILVGNIIIFDLLWFHIGIMNDADIPSGILRALSHHLGIYVVALNAMLAAALPFTLRFDRSARNRLASYILLGSAFCMMAGLYLS